MPKPVSDIKNIVQLESSNLCGCDAVLVNLIKNCRHFTGTSVGYLCDKLVTMTTFPEKLWNLKGKPLHTKGDKSCMSDFQSI
jgi:hypothetical protein